jgi:hypothetical protein
VGGHEVTREDVIALLNRSGFSVTTLSLDPDGSVRTAIVTHEYTLNVTLGFIGHESLRLTEDVLPPADEYWHTYKLGELNDAAITQHILNLKRRILTQDERMRRQSDKLIAQGFQLSGKTISLNGEIVGWLHDTSLAIRSDLPSVVRTSMTTTIFYNSADFDIRIRRQYRMLITSARRYDKYMRNERIRAVKKYFLNRKYSVPSTELFRIGETDDQPNS